MFLIGWFPRTLIFVFLTLSMLSIGMQTTKAELGSLLKSRGLLARLLIANFVLVPVVGIFIVRTISLTSGTSTAFLLLACTPGGTSSLQYTPWLKGPSLWAASSSFITTFLAVFISPLLLVFALPPGVPLVVPAGRSLLFILLFLLVPMLAGLLIRHLAKHLAERLSKPLAIAGFIVISVAGMLIWKEQKQAIRAIGIKALLCMLVFVVVAMCVGWFMSGRRQKDVRPIFTMVTGMRNVALCLLMSVKAYPDAAVQTPLVAFSALMVIPNMLFYYFISIRSLIAWVQARVFGRRA